MLIPIILTLIGLLLVFIEFFAPGGILAIVGGLLLISGITASSFAPVNFWLKGGFFIGAITLTALACQIALWIIKKQKKGALFLDQDQEGFQASGFDQELIGKLGSVFTDLKPSGHIEIEGKRYQALSDGLYLKKGTPILVEGGRGAYLIVKEKL